MQIRHALTSVAFVVFAWAAVHAAVTEDAPAPPAGPAGAQQRGRGPGPNAQTDVTPGRQGGGGRGPNYAQNQRPAGDPVLIARGKALFGVNCTACHGADLRGGDQGGPNLRTPIVEGPRPARSC